MLRSLRRSASPRSSCSSFATGCRPGRSSTKSTSRVPLRSICNGVTIYENTHPPVTKLLITLSVIMFGGLPNGDTSYGWRFLNVVAGALAVVICFYLAKRITRSTLFGAYAAVLFGLDGMHCTRSRASLPRSVRRLLFDADALRVLPLLGRGGGGARTTHRPSWLERTRARGIASLRLASSSSWRASVTEHWRHASCFSSFFHLFHAAYRLWRSVRLVRRGC